MGFCCGMRGWAITTAISMAVCAIFAGTMPLLINRVIDSQLVLDEGTMTWNNWFESPVPMYVHFYFFNVLNPNEITNHQAKPILQQVGPYVFQEVHKKVNATKHDNHTLQFQQERSWYFIPEKTNGSLSDMITTLNVPYVGAGYAMRFQDKWVKSGFNAFTRVIGVKNIFVTKNVSELLFEGYSDPLLDSAKFMPPGVNITIPPYDRFGWFYQRNNSAEFDGIFNIFTGTDDVSNVNLIDTWNGLRQTSFYDSYCGMINGSFGEGWPPYQQRTSISMYSSDLCRSITFDYIKDVWKNGIEFNRYAGTRKTFASKEENPDNACFCHNSDGSLTCPPGGGVVNSSVCRYGSPAFVSFPHFYAADQFYVDQVEGLDPDQEKHEFRIDLNPRMSVPSAVRARFQINMMIEPVKDVRFMKDFKEPLYLPVVWFGVDADLDDTLLGMVKLALLSPPVTMYIFIGFAVINLIVASTLTVKLRNRNKRALL